MGTVTIEVNLNVDITDDLGPRFYERSMDILWNMFDGRCDYHKYWKRISTLSRWTEKAYLEYLKDNNQKTAAELIKCFNSLKAKQRLDNMKKPQELVFIGSADPLTKVLSGDIPVNQIKKAFQEAKAEYPLIESLHSKDHFENAFVLFDWLKKYGGDVELICKKLTR